MDTTNWKWFRYDEIFDIRKGKRLTKENMTEGNIRYIGAIDSNNGLSAFIGNDSQLHQGNTISVSYMVATCVVVAIGLILGIVLVNQTSAQLEATPVEVVQEEIEEVIQAEEKPVEKPSPIKGKKAEPVQETPKKESLEDLFNEATDLFKDL